MRTVPSDVMTAPAVCAFWSAMGTSNAAVLYQNDQYGRSLMEHVVSACFDLGLAIQTFGYEIAGTAFNAKSIEAAVEKLAGSGLRYVFVAVTYAPSLAVIVDSALAQGLLAADDPDSSCWGFGGGISTGDFASLSGEARAALHGSITIRAAGAIDGTPAWEHYVNQWPSLDLADFQPHLPAAWQLSDDFFRAPVVEPRRSMFQRDGAAFAYDAIIAAGLMACAQVPTGPLPPNFGTLIWEGKQELAFDGLTGRVSFDEKGERSNSTATFALENYMHDNATGRFAPELRALFTSGAWQWQSGTMEASGLIFDRGRVVPPPDSGNGDGGQGIWSSKSFRRLSGSTLGITVFVILLLLASIVSDHRRYSRHMQGTMRWVDDDSECIPGAHHVVIKPEPEPEPRTCSITY